MTVDYYSSPIVANFDKKMNHLISLCGDLRGQYKLNQIQSNKLHLAKNA